MTALLEVEGVSLAFGGLQALSEVSLQVPEGAIVGLIGPNGAGKTTLFNVVSGLQASDVGRVSFRGQDVSRLDAAERAELGMRRSFQNLGLIPDETVMVNLLAAQHLSPSYAGWHAIARPRRWWHAEREMRRRAVEVATRVKVDDVLDQCVDDLSFAEARFTELACVLVQGASLLLLDEPTTGLDVAEVARLLAVLRAERDAGRTILLVAHDVRFVMQLCDHVYVLAEGRLLSEGAPADVQRDPRVVEVYLGRSA